MHLTSSDISRLHLFRTIVDHGGFLNAQLFLNTSQSAISFHISKLEDRLGFKLCKRGRAGFSLTDRGKIVYEKTARLFTSIDHISNELNEMKNLITGRLKLGIADNIIFDIEFPVQAILNRFICKAPDVVLDITVSPPDRLSAEIRGSKLDLIISPSIGYFSECEYRDIFLEDHSLYCGRGHALFACGEITKGLVEGYPFVVRPYADFSKERKIFGTIKAGARASNMEATAMFILSGHYIGYLPRHYARHWIDRGDMRVILPGECDISSQFQLVKRRSSRTPLIIRAFEDEVLHFVGSCGDGQ